MPTVGRLVVVSVMVTASIVMPGRGGAPAWSQTVAPGEDPVLVGAGDIANCGTPGAEATAKVLDGVAGTVFTTGDNSQETGSDAQFARCYDPAWGRHKARTRPVPGNHDYETPGAAGYYRYFGGAAGDPAKGYYSYALGAWHVVALNSNCGAIGGCGSDSPQERWLRADLAANPSRCILAYWHHPRFFSPTEGPSAVAGGPSSDHKMAAMWRDLQVAGADVVISGHRHVYERFSRMDADGRADPAGVRQFIVGTGGDALQTFGRNLAANSEARIEGVQGVLKLTLRADRFDWEFLRAVDGAATDSGSESCGVS
jgi:hypothetical protein